MLSGKFLDRPSPACRLPESYGIRRGAPCAQCGRVGCCSCGSEDGCCGGSRRLPVHGRQGWSPVVVSTRSAAGQQLVEDLAFAVEGGQVAFVDAEQPQLGLGDPGEQPLGRGQGGVRVGR